LFVDENSITSEDHREMEYYYFISFAEGRKFSRIALNKAVDWLQNFKDELDGSIGGVLAR